MRTINVGDEVVMIEYWLNETGVLAPEQTSLDSRLYGVCLSDYTYNSIIAGPEMGEAGHIFQKWSNSKTDTDGLKEGDSLAFHLEDAAEYFPLLPIEEIRTPSEEETPQQK